MPDVLPYLLPDLGEGMTEAELVQWRVAVGDHVTRDQIVVHVQTDKAEVELPVPASGTVVRLGAEVGDLVPVGAPLLELIPDEGTALGGTPVRGHRQPPFWRRSTAMDALQRRQNQEAVAGLVRWRRRRCGSWPRSWASTSPRSSAPGPADG